MLSVPYGLLTIFTINIQKFSTSIATKLYFPLYFFVAFSIFSLLKLSRHPESIKVDVTVIHVFNKDLGKRISLR